LGAFIFDLPSVEEQKEIVRRVEKLFQAIDLMAQECQKASQLCDRLEQATLAKAFRGELVPQDPNDEPAAALLERILAEKQDQPKGKAVKSKQKPGEKS
jgi:type I restriction enzyme S subunit